MGEQRTTGGATRDSAEINTEALGVFLRERGLGSAGDAVVVERLPFGFSNLTYQVSIGGQALILRRPPVGANVRSGHDMGREYRTLTALLAVYSKIPRPLVYCEDATVIGAPFYVMELVDGVVLRRPLPEDVTLEPGVIRAVSEAFLDNLVTIHGLDCTAGPLSQLGRPEGYAQRQVSGWIERYGRAKTDEIADLERVAAWLGEHTPERSDAALIHNDYKYDNVMLERADLTRIRAVLDWEMATLGDPLMDLGATLAYWVDPDDPDERGRGPLNDGLTTLPDNLRRSDLVQRYATRSGRDVGNIVFYFVFGLYKNAVIAQQIHARYAMGLIPDKRFGAFLPVIQALGATAARAIELQRIERLG